MPGIVESPTIVKRALEQSGDLFAAEPQRGHFGEYITGLIIAERKTVLGGIKGVRNRSRNNRSLRRVGVPDIGS